MIEFNLIVLNKAVWRKHRKGDINHGDNHHEKEVCF